MMIKTEREYQAMLSRLDEDKKFLNHQRKQLEEMGFSQEEVNLAMEPVMSFHAQLKEDIEYYEKIKRFEFGSIKNLAELGKMLIGLRIALGITQTELASRLQVSEAQVSRDEKNEYHGISLEKAQRILDALQVNLVSQIEEIPLKIA